MNFRVLRFFLFLVSLLLYTFLPAQYAPPAGQPGTTAMHKDSSAFIGWASTCIIEKGFINLSDTTMVYNGSNKATYGSYLNGIGQADQLVVSLGDHGSAVLGFKYPIINGSGPDFAIFENSFDDTFLELAFVEVSSDGRNFIRFPAVSHIPDDEQVPTFGTIDARSIHNLAGKYRVAYGTPFDLEDLKDSAGININLVTYVRIIDVGGCIVIPYASYDSQGHKINDPWPTPFDTGGFDLDAVGVIHDTSKINPDGNPSAIKIYPNPVEKELNIVSAREGQSGVTITDVAGRIFLELRLNMKTVIDLSSLPAGIYLARFSLPDGTSISKKIVKI